MTPVEKRIARLRLEPLSEPQQRLLSFQPLATALVDRVFITTCMTADAFTVPDAIDLLYSRLLDAFPNRERKTLSYSTAMRCRSCKTRRS